MSAPELRAIAQVGHTGTLGAMHAAENVALSFYAVADDFAAALRTIGREHVNGTLK